MAVIHPVDEPRLRLRYWSWWLAVFFFGWSALLILGFDQPALLLRQYWPLVLVGFVGALLGNATAVGGGLVFVPTMTLVYGLAPLVALKLALASQVFGMSSGAIAWAQRRMIPKDGLLPAIPGLLIGSLISVFILRPDSALVKTVFGPVSIAIGLSILFVVRHEGSTDNLPSGARVVLFFVSIMGGLLTGWVAIGQGELVAAVLMLGYGIKTERSIGLGVVLLAVNSIVLVGLHHFTYGDLPWTMAMFTGLGCVFGARMGPYLSQWVGQNKLKIAFAAVAIGDGLIFALHGL